MQNFWLEFVQWDKDDILAGVFCLHVVRILDVFFLMYTAGCIRRVRYMYTQVCFAMFLLNLYRGTIMHFEQKFFAYMNTEAYVSFCSHIQLFP